MKTKLQPQTILLFLLTAAIALLSISYGTAAFPGSATPMPTATPGCELYPCPEDSYTLTAAMGLTMLAPPPSLTPIAGVTMVSGVGDLGWGAVHGRVIDTVSGLPLDGVTVQCAQSSYTSISQYTCRGVTTTNADGLYVFLPVFFHDTDRIILHFTAPGYSELRFEEGPFTRPEVHADVGMFPETYMPHQPTPLLMCTPPPCFNGMLTCTGSGGCPGGCGTVCIDFTSTP